MNSVKTQLPYEYYALPFCKYRGSKGTEALNLGEVMHGSRIHKTVYEFDLGQDQGCKIACRMRYTQEDVEEFSAMIEDDYRVNL